MHKGKGYSDVLMKDLQDLVLPQFRVSLVTYQGEIEGSVNGVHSGQNGRLGEQLTKGITWVK